MTPVYLLGCSELPGRLDTTLAHLKENDCHPVVWRAAHGKTWGLETVLEYDEGKRISSGHVALNVSSYFMWQAAYLKETEADSVVFFEDDVVVPVNFPCVLSDLQIQLNYSFPDWDLVFLGLAEQEPHVWQKVTERIGLPNSPFCKLNDPFGTHAMMIRRRAIPVLLDHMTRAERNLDQQLWKYVLQPGHLKNWCAVLPSIVEQRTFDHRMKGKPEWAPSTIDDGVGEKTFFPVFSATETEAKKAVGFEAAQRDPRHESDGREKPSPELYAITTALIDQFPCIYRGEFTDTPGKTPQGRTVPISECARLNTLCYSRRGVSVVDPPGVVSCEYCPHRLEMSADSPRDKLPLPEGHFNPSIAVWNGKLILATRDSWGHSRICLWELHNTKTDWSGAWSVTPIGSYSSDHPQAPRLEDPRLFVSTAPEDGQKTLCAMLNLPDGYPPKLVQVGFVRFAHDLSGITKTQVFQSPHGNLYEKNWVPFEDDHGLHWVYSTKPEHTVLGECQSWSTPNKLPWTGGVIRGGAAPVLVQRGSSIHMSANTHDVYYHFFHGCLKQLRGNIYTTGCAVFDSHPPYQVLRQTKTPLIWPDLPAVGEEVVKRYVCWPGGAVPHAGAWHLALGIDDTNCRIVRIPFEQVEQALGDVPEDDNVTGIRNTPIASGTHKEN